MARNTQECGAQGSINAYERSKILRVQENKARLEEIGINTIAKSLTSLVDCHKGKKGKKGKENLDTSNQKDGDYIPDYDATSDNDELMDVRRKRNFIAPMSMKYVSYAKQRQGVGNPCDMSQQRHQLRMRSIERNDIHEQVSNKDGSRKKGDGSSLTVGEMILMKNQALQQKETSIDKVSQSSRARRELFSPGITYPFVEENNEVRSSDLNVLGPQFTQTVNEDDNILEYESERNDNEDEFFYSEDESMPNGEEEEGEPLQLEELEQEALRDGHTRGPTMMHHVHVRPFEKRKTIILNELGQPIGPEEEDTIGEFSRFLGTIARDYSYAPLICRTWRKVTDKDKMWEYVLRKYIVPEEGKAWVLKSIGAAWRTYKCRFKKKYYYKYEDNKTRWKHRPKRVPEEDFKKLLSLWNKKEEKLRSSIARERRKGLKNMHTAGPKSFARIREEMKNEDPNKELPSLAQMFERTSKRKEGKVYADTYEDTAKKIEEMKKYQPPEDGSGEKDAFLAVMGKEYDGRRRIYGRGVTNKLLRKVNENGTSYVVPRELMESLTVEKTQILNMQKELEADYERRKAELENMQKNLESEREKMAEDILTKLIGKLPPEVARQLLV